MHTLSRRTPWFLLLCALGASAALAAARRPNILWITCEDTGPQLGCYGDTYAETPNLDRFAERSLRYRRVWSTAPVCAPARTAIISGAYPSRFGAEHMRSDVPMPPGTRMFPQYLREAGYYCANNVKEDYNLIKPGQVWDDSSTLAHWRNRAPGQPFFAVVNFTTTHESQIRARPHELKHDPAKAPLPAYHPDTPEVRRDWAQYYDKVTEMDAQVGRVLRELEADGLADETIVFFYGDHGPGMPRGKRWPYNSGLQVPLIVHVPEALRHLAPKGYSPGGWSDRLVGFVDLAPTVLSLAGVKPPAWMDGGAFMGPHATPPARYLFGERGRMDERPDLVRSVRNERFVYVRQYQPHLPYGQHVSYMFLMPTARVWKQLYDEGKLSPPRTHFWEPKPAEELYDLATDPDEVRNLVNSPEHRAVLNELRAALRQHLLKTRDLGFLPEGERARLAPGQSPTTIPETRSGYPMKLALAMADAASLGRPEALTQLRRGLRAQSSAERYWAALGILMRGAAAVAASRNELRGLLHDEAPSGRIVAAQALAQHGAEADREAALATLKSLVSPATNGHAVAVEALNAVDALGALAAPLHDFLRSMDRKAPGFSRRIEEHAPRLLAHILGEPSQE